MPDWLRPTPNGVELSIRLTPRSSADRVDGLKALDSGEQVLAARVRAVPEDGKANAALQELVARWLRVPKRDVSLVSGAASRLKTVAVTGNGDDLARTCRRLTGAPAGQKIADAEPPPGRKR